MDAASLTIKTSGLLGVAEKPLLLSRLVADVYNFGGDTIELLY